MIGWLRRQLPWIATAIVSVFAVTITQELWHMHPGVPLAYSGDALPHALAVDQVVDNGWFWSDSRLGAPFGQHFQDWPLPDLLMLFVARFLSLFTSSWPVAVNALYLMTYPAVAVSAFWVLRKFRVSAWIAGALGVVYSVLRYHAMRGEQHLFLSGYFTVPLGIWLAVCVMSGDSLFGRSSRFTNVVLRWVTWRSVGTLALCVLIALSGVYYTAFTLLFVFTALLVRLVHTRSWRPVVPAVFLIGTMLTTVVLNTLPTLEYSATHGSSGLTASREQADTERFGLKLSQVLLPINGHRIDEFGNTATRYFNTFPIPSEGIGSYAGIIGATGIVVLFGVALGSAVRRRRQDEEISELGRLSYLMMTAYLIGTVGGVSTLISLFVTSQIRSWNRISVAMAFLGLAAIGLLVDRFIAWQRRRRFGKPSVVVAPVLAIALLGVGVWDQSADSFVPPYEDTSRLFLSDQTYFRQIESTMPKGAAVYQLPFVSFPEVPPMVDLGAYDMLEPYLQTEHMRWSFGGIKGRLESEWQFRIDDDAAPTLLEDVIAAGFTGLYIDRRGYEDHGAAVEADVRATTGIVPFVDSSGNKAFYDLRGYAAMLNQRESAALAREKAELLFPVFFEPWKSLYAEEHDDVRRWYWAIGPTAKVTVFNADARAKSTTVSFGLQSATGQPASYAVTWPDGSTDTYRTVGSEEVLASHTFDAKSGRSKLQVTSDARRIDSSIDPRELYFRMIEPTVGPVL